MSRACGICEDGRGRKKGRFVLSPETVAVC